MGIIKKWVLKMIVWSKVFKNSGQWYLKYNGHIIQHIKDLKTI
jgi:hypothetical protein